MYVFRSVCLLTSLLKLDKGVSPDVLIFSIPETLVHWFQIISDFLYVSLVVGTFPWWNPTVSEISPALDEISFSIFMDTFLKCRYTCSKWIWIFNFKFKYLHTSWIKLVTSLHYYLSRESPSEISCLVSYLCLILSEINTKFGGEFGRKKGWRELTY